MPTQTQTQPLTPVLCCFPGAGLLFKNNNTKSPDTSVNLGIQCPYCEYMFLNITMSNGFAKAHTFLIREDLVWP